MATNIESNIEIQRSILNRETAPGHPDSFLVDDKISSYNQESMRRKIITNWKFQLSFAFAVIRGTIVGILIPGLACLFTLYLMSQHATLMPNQKLILINGLNQLSSILIALLSLFSGLYGLLGFILSQRFVGPMKRIETWSVQHLMRQDPGALKVREKDELEGVANSLNRVIRKKQEVELV